MGKIVTIFTLIMLFVGNIYATDWSTFNPFSGVPDATLSTNPLAVSSMTVSTITAPSGTYGVAIDTYTVVTSTLMVTNGSNLKSVLYTVATDGTGDYNCDGSSDQTEINSAITACIAAGGGTVHLKAGTYTIDGTINIDGDNVILEGEGVATHINLDADCTVLNIGSATTRVHISVKNLWIDGNNKHTTTTPCGLWYYKCNYGVLENLNIGECARGIVLNTSDYVKILKSNVWDTNKAQGITLEAGSNYCLVEGSFIDNPTSHAIYINASAYNDVCNNNIRDAGSNGIYFYNTSHSSVANANIIIDSVASGVSLWHASTPADYCVISDNTIYNSGAYGIYIGSGCDETVVVSNCVEVSGTTDISDNGTDSVVANNSYNPYSITASTITAPSGYGEITVSTSVSMAGDIDFNQYKAIAMICDNGATAPTSPTKGQWFLHTPTGRNILMMYDGSNWISIESIGSMTVYVDNTDGTDGINYGGAVDSNAFKTIQYAVDAIPGLIGGNVIISLNNEDYTENVDIWGKQFTGSYTITVQGTMSEEVATRNVTAATYNTCTIDGANLTVNAHVGQVIRITAGTGDGQEAVILSNTASIVTIIGSWDRSYPYGDSPGGSTPDATSDIVIEDWDTSTYRIHLDYGQKSVVLYHMNTNEASSGLGSVLARNMAAVELNICRVEQDNSELRALYGTMGAHIIARSSLFFGGDTWTANIKACTFGFYNCWFDQNALSNSMAVVSLQDNCDGEFFACRVDGMNANVDGVKLDRGGIALFGWNTNTGVTLTGAGGTGVDLHVLSGSGAASAADADNTIDSETIDAATFGWKD